MFERLVVTNHGPSIARDVDLRIVEGEVLAHSFDHYFPLPLLHPGQDFHFEFTRATHQWGPQSVELTWRDRRRSSQSTVVHVSPQKLV